MRILLTNDDGIRAPGIIAMHDALKGLGDPPLEPFCEDVFAVAPETVQSAASHGVTFWKPLMAGSVEMKPHFIGVAVDGRPADCVKVALASLWPERYGARTRPDVVVSGMNVGANVGVNVIYSGTVAAAIEAAFLGIPAVAISLHIGAGTPDFDRAARLGRSALERVIASGLLTRHSCVNINVPRVEKGRPIDDPEIVVCPMNLHGLNDLYERRESPRGDVYYWAAGTGFDFAVTDPDSDVRYLLDGKITLTPLAYDLTDRVALDGWRSKFQG